MVISDIVMTIGVGISQKKKIKNLTPVTILWFDPYIYPGKDRTWYIRSSVSFEAIRSVMEYNNLLVRNMLPHDHFNHDDL